MRHGLPIATPELRLRHFVPGDAPRIRALNAEPSTRRWLASHVYATPEDAVEALAYLVACYAAPEGPREAPYVLAVERLGDGQLIGHVGFSPIRADVEVSYAIAEAARGRGWGAQALARACAWVREGHGIDSLVAATASDNAASRRTLERAGFVHERDEVAPFQGATQAVSRYRWPAPTGA